MDTILHTRRRQKRRRPTGAGALALALLSALAVVAFAGSASATTQAPPVNTAAPTITGTAAVGSTLTAQNGTWTNSPTAFQYRWRRCDTAGAACVNIAGALGAAKTYVVVPADAGHTLRVVVTAVNADGARSATSAQTDVVTSPGAPANTERPTISGTAEEGQILTASDGSWSGSPTTFAYQWHQCDSDGSNCVNIAGATGKTYAVDAGDIGYRLRVQVTATNDKGKGTALSPVTAIVDPKTAITNTRPTLRIVSIRFVGARAYARVRICDDKPSNLAIIETDSRPTKASQTRRFSTIVAPQPCGVYTRNWVPAERFRHGRYTISLSARDASGLTSAVAKKTFVRR